MSENTENTKVRIVGETEGVSRRGFVKGGIAALGTFIAGTAVGGFAVGTYNRAKNYVTKRIGSLYEYDKAYAVRQSHQNKELLALYDEFLSPGGFRPAHTEMSHRMCHTVYGKNVPARIKELQEVSLDEVKKETAKQMKEYLKNEAPEVTFEKKQTQG
ncbi:MAG: iron hydrogenase small subunit [Actinomycetaceae bacterium]|nr:iron hydrogenase small subunit [Actinomycetaceae bacterium]